MDRLLDNGPKSEQFVWNRRDRKPQIFLLQIYVWLTTKVRENVSEWSVFDNAMCLKGHARYFGLCHFIVIVESKRIV